MARNTKIVVAAVFVLFLGVVVYSSLRLGQVTVEVCVEFNGQTNCGTASAPTEQEAIRTATDNACALITSGMTESMACSRTLPKSIRRLDD